MCAAQALPVPGRPTLLCSGDLSLLDAPRRAVLVSRTPRRPVPATPWVRGVVAAVRRSVELGETLLTGVGRDPYDVALAACRSAGGAAIVVLSEAHDAHAASGLLPERHLLVWPVERGAGSALPAASVGAPSSGRRVSAESLALRDRSIGELASCAWAIHVRRGGNMAALAASLRARGGRIEEDFATPVTRPAPSKPQPSANGLLDSAQNPALGADDDWDFVTHYTREPDGAWPGETRAEYADWLAHGPLEEQRDARDTLRRILRMGTILASGRLMPGRTPMVSFTARRPSELPALVRWRQGLRRWTFRPYGLAVRREVLAALGARRVRYLPPAEARRLPPTERLFAQPHDPPKADWSGETEWRLPGDLRLDALPRDAVLALAPGRDEAEALAREFGWPARAIGDGRTH